MSYSRAAKKPSEGDFVKAINTRSDIRLFLIFGQDPSAISDIAAKMSAEIGPDAERIDLSDDQIRKEPALLVDEACSLSLFGGARFIRLTIQRDPGIAAVENLLNADKGGCPVIATAGDLKKTNKLRKLAESSKLAMAHICYAPDENQAAAAVTALAKEAGLRMDRALAQRIARYTGQDRKLAASEVEKLALYYDAAPDRPATVEIEAFEALSAETGEENVQALVNQILSGKIRQLGAELINSRLMGVDSIRIVRAMQRRVAMLSGLRAKVDAGNAPDPLVRATRSIFFKERDDVIAQLHRWPSRRLAGLNGHLLEIERRLMGVKAELGIVILEQEMSKIARAAARAG